MYGWDLLPDKPFNPEAFHFNWRGLWDYGTGAMGDMGAHIFDAPIWALNLGMPTKDTGYQLTLQYGLYAACANWLPMNFLPVVICPQ